MWDKKRYHNDEEFRLRRIRTSRKYQKTEKGKIAMKIAYENSRKSGYNEKWHKRNINYFSVYMKDRRKEAKKNKICTRCLKRKVKNELTTCDRCRRLYNKDKMIKLTSLQKKFIDMVKRAKSKDAVLFDERFGIVENITKKIRGK